MLSLQVPGQVAVEPEVLSADLTLVELELQMDSVDVALHAWNQRDVDLSLKDLARKWVKSTSR